jgi:hypothetical protein
MGADSRGTQGTVFEFILQIATGLKVSIAAHDLDRRYSSVPDCIIEK